MILSRFSPHSFDRALSFLTAAALGMMALCFSFSFALFNIGAVLLMSCFVLKRIREKNAALFDPFLDAALLLFFLTSVFSVFQSQYRSMSLQGIQKLFRYLLLFMAARECLTKNEAVRGATWIFFAGAAIAGIDAIAQWILGQDPISHRTPILGFDALIRVSGPFGNPNTLAIYLIYFIPGMYLASRHLKSVKMRFLMGGLILILLTALGLTYSRPAATALVLSALLILILKKDWRILLFLAAGLGLSVFLAPPDIRHWISQLASPANFFYDESRYRHHQAAWNMIAKHPFFGVGINTFDVNYKAFRLPEDMIERWSAHQAYLQVWAETGLAGFLSFLMLIGTIFHFAGRGYQKMKDPFLKDTLLGFLAGSFSFLIIGFFESNFWQPRQTAFFWLWAGIMCNIARFSKRDT